MDAYMGLPDNQKMLRESLRRIFRDYMYIVIKIHDMQTF